MGIIARRIDEVHERAQRVDAPPFPKGIMLEPANGCNLRCVFCENSESARKPVMLGLAIATKILGDAYAAGAREVGFYLTGEPLLSPHLSGMVAAAKANGYAYIYLTSNGVLATPEKVRELVANGLDSIKFSINAGDAASYSRIHGRDAFETILRNLHACVEMRREQKAKGLPVTKLFVSSVYVDEPSPELLALQRETAPLVDDFVLMPANMDGHFNLRRRYNRDCSQPFTRAHVTAEGYLSVCCSDFHNHLIIADLNREAITDAWNGEVFREFRRRFMRDDLDGTLCGRCQYGCPEPAAPLPAKPGKRL